MTLSQLKQDIIDRWLSAYDELTLKEDTATPTVKTVYAPANRFELGDYNKDQFDEHRPLSTEKHPEYHFIYKLDQSENFIAYSTDWDVEPKDFPIVLKDCGVPEKEIDKWRD